eukprot:gnl/MRDRNA2_/MRDRNA2_81963_c0_seq3.p1 gnl/MRDRNA2_/MRDRNA2_81963_c0~~gnl/MRDRNA2_/MRDRNA2_81963_c0_seq3.p1  ORF type:complete len:696 (-),score=93.33 gnl/MRDRNA2_/MRDRNA2_81963_c0_seq3:475-2562(-)
MELPPKVASTLRGKGSTGSLGESEKQGHLKKGGFMGEVQALKEAAREDLHKEAYDVTNFYYKEGIMQWIAKSGPFNNITMGVITVNAVWMGVDVDLNQAKSFAESEIQFQVADIFFSIFFMVEIVIRFLAFEKKFNAMKDAWFKVDSFLIFLQVMDLWVLPASGVELPMDPSALRVLRMLRIMRLLRLMGMCPELLTLLKGMSVAVQSVSSTLLLLVTFIYVFALTFRQAAQGNTTLEDYFGSMGLCFWTLLMQGTLLDNITEVLGVIRDDSPALAALFLLFVLIANFTILNMLIGVLCEVVSAVSSSEREKMSVKYAKDSFLAVLAELSPDGTISQDEFVEFVNHPNAGPALEELGVDRDGLLSLADVFFSGDADDAEALHHLASLGKFEQSERDFRRSRQSTLNNGQRLTFGKVLEHVLSLRSSNTAVVKDIVDLRKLIQASTTQTHMCMEHLAKMQRDLMKQVATHRSTTADGTRHSCDATISAPVSYEASCGLEMSDAPKQILIHQRYELNSDHADAFGQACFEWSSSMEADLDAFEEQHSSAQATHTPNISPTGNEPSSGSKGASAAMHIPYQESSKQRTDSRFCHYDPISFPELTCSRNILLQHSFPNPSCPTQLLLRPAVVTALDEKMSRIIRHIQRESLASLNDKMNNVVLHIRRELMEFIQQLDSPTQPCPTQTNYTVSSTQVSMM